MCLVGAGEILGSFIIGPIRDFKGNRAAVIALLSLTIPAIGLTMAVNLVNKYNISVYFMCFFWGA